MIRSFAAAFALALTAGAVPAFAQSTGTRITGAVDQTLGGDAAHIVVARVGRPATPIGQAPKPADQADGVIVIAIGQHNYSPPNRVFEETQVAATPDQEAAADPLAVAIGVSIDTSSYPVMIGVPKPE